MEREREKLYKNIVFNALFYAWDERTCCNLEYFASNGTVW